MTCFLKQTLNRTIKLVLETRKPFGVVALFRAVNSTFLLTFIERNYSARKKNIKRQDRGGAYLAPKKPVIAAVGQIRGRGACRAQRAWVRRRAGNQQR